MVEIKTKYNRKKKAAIITSPTEIRVKENEYRAIQKLTNNQFGYFCITNRIKLRTDSIVGLNFSGLEVNTSDLTKELLNLNSLKIFNLSNNSIIKIPEYLMDLKKLKELRLTYNRVRSLPKNISKLQSLKELYLSYNPITSLPESIIKMDSLNYLAISKQNLDNQAKKIIKKLKQKIEVLIC